MGARDWASGLSARHGADTGRRGRLPANIVRSVEMVRVLADYGSENSRSRPGSQPRPSGGRSRQTQRLKRARSGSRPVQPDRRRPGQARRRNRKPGRVVTTLARSRAGHRVRPWARDRTIAETGPAGARRLHLVRRLASDLHPPHPLHCRSPGSATVSPSSTGQQPDNHQVAVVGGKHERRQSFGHARVCVLIDPSVEQLPHAVQLSVAGRFLKSCEIGRRRVHLQFP